MGYVLMMVLGLSLIAIGRCIDTGNKKDVRQDKEQEQGASAVAVRSVSDAKEARRRYDLMLKIEELRESIRDDALRFREDDTPELKDANEYMASELEELLAAEIETEEQYDEIYWLYNYGELRTEEEVLERENARRAERYVSSGDFDRDCATTNAAAFWIPFVVTFVIVFFAIDFWPIGIPVGIFVALIPGAIGMAIGHRLNLLRADTNGIQAGNPRVAYERRELDTLAVGGAVTTARLAHRARKTVGDITNVDGWKHMK